MRELETDQILLSMEKREKVMIKLATLKTEGVANLLQLTVRVVDLLHLREVQMQIAHLDKLEECLNKQNTIFQRIAK